MSMLDTSLAGPTSTVGAWAALLPVLLAERATRIAAAERDLAAQPAKERTPADAQADADRYAAWSKLGPVRKNAWWLADVNARHDAAIAELAGGAQ